MGGKSLTVRTKEWLEENGYTVHDTVEQYIHFAKRKKDLFGMFDVLAVGKGETVAVQVTSYSHVAERVKKIEGKPDILKELREAKWKMLVHGWHKKKGRFVVRVVEIP